MFLLRIHLVGTTAVSPATLTKKSGFRIHFLLIDEIVTKGIYFFASGQDVLDPPINITGTFRQKGTKFNGHLSWNLAPHSKQYSVLSLVYFPYLLFFVYV